MKKKNNKLKIPFSKWHQKYHRPNGVLSLLFSIGPNPPHLCVSVTNMEFKYHFFSHASNVCFHKGNEWQEKLNALAVRRQIFSFNRQGSHLGGGGWRSTDLQGFMISFFPIHVNVNRTFD